MNGSTGRWVGIDVSKGKLDVAVLDERDKIKSHVFANDSKGHAALITWLEQRGCGAQLAQVCLEATGCYRRGDPGLRVQRLAEARQGARDVVVPRRVSRGRHRCWHGRPRCGGCSCGSFRSGHGLGPGLTSAGTLPSFGDAPVEACACAPGRRASGTLRTVARLRRRLARSGRSTAAWRNRRTDRAARIRSFPCPRLEHARLRNVSAAPFQLKSKFVSITDRANSASGKSGSRESARSIALRAAAR